MSMNLVGRIKNHYIDFPYQTPSEVTRAVMKASTREEKLKIIKTDLDRWKDTQEVYERCVVFINDTDITLEMI